MLRIDQIPSDDYINIMVAVETAALSAERDAGSTALPRIDEQFAQLAKGFRAAKALLEAHRYPKFAELAAVPATTDPNDPATVPA